MEMIDRLSPMMIAINHDPEPRTIDAHVFCHLVCNQQKPTSQLDIPLPQIQQRSDVPFGNNQNMQGRLGVNIFEGQYLFILV